jgi:hypothetical protein
MQSFSQKTTKEEILSRLTNRCEDNITVDFNLYHEFKPWYYQIASWTSTVGVKWYVYCAAWPAGLCINHDTQQIMVEEIGLEGV